MASTNFVPGTVVTSDWLNDINNLRYKTPTEGGGSLLLSADDGTGSIVYPGTANNLNAFLLEISRQYAIPVRRYLPVGYVPGRSSCSSAVQSAINAAIESGNGCVSFEGLDYLFDTEVDLGAKGLEGGVALLGPAANSQGTRANLIQKDINTSCFRVKSLNCRASHFSATVFAGATLDDVGAPITVTAVTTSTITLSKDPWPGQNPVVWTSLVNVPLSTDGTAFPSIIQFTLQNLTATSGGSIYASSAIKNVDGTVTLTGCKGASGTANTFIAGTVGFKVTQWISQAHNLLDAVFVAPTPAVFFLDVAENQWWDHLWFNQVGACFGRATFGSGAGQGISVGNFGSFSDMVVDGAGWWITAVGDITNLQANGIQLFAVRHCIKSSTGNFVDSILTNIKTQACTKFLELAGDMRGVSCTASNFEAISGPSNTYINGFFSVGGQVLNSSWGAGNNYGRSAAGTAPWTIESADGFSLDGANIRSWNEAGTGGFLAVTGATFVRSTVSANWSDVAGLSTGKKIVFTNTACDITGSIFGDDCVFQTNHTQLGWQVVTAFQNSWANAGGGTSTAAYYRDNAGNVHLSGTLSGGSAGSVMFTLPAYCAPTVGPMRIVAGAYYTGTAYAPWCVDVGIDGTVTAIQAAAAWHHLDGTQFARR